MSRLLAVAFLIARVMSTSDPLDDCTAQLRELAAVAIEHAKTFHNVALSVNDWAATDAVLIREKASASSATIESLSACYGAWLGSWAVTTLNGCWIGLHEPVPPRVTVQGLVFSPIDAVRRLLLTGDHSLSLIEITDRLRQWKRQADESQDRQTFLTTNRHAWDARHADVQFTSSGTSSLEPDTVAAAIDPWLQQEGLSNRDLLCLASGGGRHAPLFAAAGARVTVVDLSDRQLDHDRHASASMGIPIRTLVQSIDQLQPLSSSAFDVVVQPVSSCYLPNLQHMFAEIARVLRPGGLYVSQHKQPGALQAEQLEINDLPSFLISLPLIDGLRLPDTPKDAGANIREPGTTEYLHSFGAILGGICNAGFVIEDVTEPPRGDAFAPINSLAYRATFLAPYLKIKARRR